MDGTTKAAGKASALLRPSLLYRVFNVIFALLFFGIVLLAIFAGGQAEYSWYWLLAAAVGGVAAAFLLSRLFAVLPPPSKRTEVIVVLVFFALYATAQVLAGWQLRVRPGDGWDFGVVHQYASAYAQTGALPDEYFLWFPNNTGVYSLLAIYYSALSLFGVTDFETAAFVLNIVAIDGALVLLYFCGRRLFGAKRAIMLLLCAFLTLPFFMYVPIWYTDTLTLVFPVAAVLLWLQARALWRGGEMGRAVGRFCILSAVVGLGAVLKATVLIVWLAIAIDLLVLLCGKGRLRMLLAGLLAVALVAVGGTLLARNNNMLPRYDYRGEGIPFTHWIMMGLAGDGGYNDDDYQMVLAVEPARRAAFVADEIGNRLQDMGVLGTLEHLGNKLAATFGDGTYTALTKLDREVLQPGFLNEFFMPMGRWYDAVVYYAFAVEMAMLVWMAVAALKALVRQNNALTFMRIALFGLVLFLLIWETRARYLVNYLPLFLLCAVEAAPLPGTGRAARRQARQAALAAALAPIESLDEALPQAAPAASSHTVIIPAVAPAPQATQMFAAIPADATGEIPPLDLFAMEEMGEDEVPPPEGPYMAEEAAPESAEVQALDSTAQIAIAELRDEEALPPEAPLPDADMNE